MRVEHDERTGRVRCDDESLDLLLRDPSTGPGSLAADERSRAALDAVGHPVTEGRVVVAGPAGVLDHRFWIAPGAAAFFLALGAGDGDGQSAGAGDLVGVVPALVPVRLAELVGLGPRRVDGERAPREVAADLLADALHASDLRRSSALAVLDARRAWRLDVRTSGEDGEEGQDGQDGAADRTMTVLDTHHGYWLVAGDGAPRLLPTTATVLWRRLTTVLA